MYWILIWLMCLFQNPIWPWPSHTFDSQWSTSCKYLLQQSNHTNFITTFCKKFQLSTKYQQHMIVMQICRKCPTLATKHKTYIATTCTFNKTCQLGASWHAFDFQQEHIFSRVIFSQHLGISVLVASTGHDACRYTCITGL
jgi:hypothetical protein